MENVLKPGIYSGDNGSLTCHSCAGMTAKSSGYDLDGTKMKRQTRLMNMRWFAEFGEYMTCERCKKTWLEITPSNKKPYNATVARNLANLPAWALEKR